MDRQKLINEIRGLQKTKAKFSLDDVETEIKKRKESPYNKIADYDELPDDDDNAISEYLASPKFRRLALEILGGVAGAYTGGTFFAAQAAYVLL
jgi:hypothetical protein